MAITPENHSGRVAVSWGGKVHTIAQQTGSRPLIVGMDPILLGQRTSPFYAPGTPNRGGGPIVTGRAPVRPRRTHVRALDFQPAAEAAGRALLFSLLGPPTTSIRPEVPCRVVDELGSLQEGELRRDESRFVRRYYYRFAFWFMWGRHQSRWTIPQNRHGIWPRRWASRRRFFLRAGWRAVRVNYFLCHGGRHRFV